MVLLNFLPINSPEKVEPTIIFGLRLDFWEHFLIFSVITVFVKLAFNLSFRNTLKNLSISVIVVLAALLETAQVLTPNRVVSWSDFFLSIRGVGIGSFF